MKQKIVICDQNQEYVLRLGRALSTKYKDRFQVYLYHSLSTYEKESKGIGAEICLLDECWERQRQQGSLDTSFGGQDRENSIDSRQGVSCPRTFYLSKEKDRGDSYIYRYQSVDKIVHCLEETSTWQRGIIGLFYPMGEERIWSFLDMLWREVGHSSLCIINLESFGRGKATLKKEMSVIDIIDMYRQSKEVDLEVLESTLEKEREYSILQGSLDSLDLLDIRLEEWQVLIKALETLGYSHIILVMGLRIRNLYPLMDMCQRVFCLMVDKGEWVEELMWQIERSPYKEVSHKLEWIGVESGKEGISRIRGI